MDWSVKVASNHPDLAGALIAAHEDWLNILLSDGRSFRFRPGALIREDAPEAAREDILNRLLAIGAAQATYPDAPPTSPDANPSATQPATPSASPEPPSTPPMIPTGMEPDLALEYTDVETLLPLVRSADFFLQSHRDGDSIVYLPMTPFVGVGLFRDDGEKKLPVHYSDIAEDMRDVGELMTEAAMNLRQRSDTGAGLSLGMGRLGGAQVYTFLAPRRYELSWFCDLDMIQHVAEELAKERPGDIPLFIPAAWNKLYIVFADDPNLLGFFKALSEDRYAEDVVYPLPHTVASDGWREWVPLPGDEIATVLGDLRTFFQERIYGQQVKHMSRWGDFGMLKTYHARRLKTGESVSSTTWDAADKHGSVPETDFITFVREASPHPWETEPAVSLTIRSHVARDVWREGFHLDEDAWPPRWTVNGFPTKEELIALRDAADREV